jgi:hypothetical protein
MIFWWGKLKKRGDLEAAALMKEKIKFGLREI